MSDLLQVLQGDALAVLRALPDESVHCCVTSPPYWGLRNYGVEGQIGLEKTPEEYVAKMVEVFGEVRRVIRDDGTLWLNLGDSYAGSGKGPTGHNGLGNQEERQGFSGSRGVRIGSVHGESGHTSGVTPPTGWKAKDLIGIPWRVAFALQADGWYLRSDIIWHKPNPMPESVTDRPTKAHEYLFLLSKSAKYFYDAEAIKEDSVTDEDSSAAMTFGSLNGKVNCREYAHTNKVGKPWEYSAKRNKRSVWTVSTSPYPDAHFATYPPELITPCILAGCPAGGTVLDPFAGSGTTGQVALELGRKAILIELNPAYIELIHQRTNVTPGFSNLTL